ncbi:hypothetical protein [Pseudomonas syringae]|uniref:hypothetical protein n=1 Tax=Pseudomonas syringae TaxID=317 RepID=UPI000EFEEC50|nr:hypothetical protein [Pseudomonas azotoformans]
MTTAFASLFQCQFKLSESERRLLALAQQYVTETEAYDRTVCTGPIQRDGIMPASRHEFALVNRNAHQTMDRLCAENPDFTRQQLRRAAARVGDRGQIL